MLKKIFLNLSIIKYLDWGILIAGFFVILTTVYGIYINYSPVPFWDQWNGLLNFIIDFKSGNWAAWFEQHNEHRIIFSKLLFWLDYIIFDGLYKLLFITAVLIQFCFLILFIVLLVLAKIKNNLILYSGLGLCLLFSWLQHENWTWAFQSQFFAVYFFAFMSFISLFCFKYFNSKDEASRYHSYLAFLVSIISAFLSTFSMINGLLTFPLLILLAYLIKINVMNKMFIAFAGIISYFLFFNNYIVYPGFASSINNLTEYPIQFVLYFFAYIGSPANDKYIAIIIGIFLFIYFSYLFFIEIKDKDNPFIVLIIFILFLFGSALFTALGRVSLGIEQALSSRYSTPSLYIWLSMLILWCQRSSDFVKGIDKKKIYVNYIILLLVVIHLLFSQFKSVSPNYLFLFNKEIALLSLAMEIKDDKAIKNVYPNVQTAIEISNRAKELEIGVFSLDFYRMVKTKDDIYLDISMIHNDCYGSVESISQLATDSAVIISGWVYDISSLKVPKHLIVIDEQGMVIGYGVSGEPKGDVTKYFSKDINYLPINIGWKAYVNYYDWNEASVYAITEHGLCKIPCKIKLP